MIAHQTKRGDGRIVHDSGAGAQITTFLRIGCFRVGQITETQYDITACTLKYPIGFADFLKRFAVIPASAGQMRGGIV